MLRRKFLQVVGAGATAIFGGKWLVGSVEVSPESTFVFMDDKLSEETKKLNQYNMPPTSEDLETYDGWKGKDYQNDPEVQDLKKQLSCHMGRTIEEMEQLELAERRRRKIEELEFMELVEQRRREGDYSMVFKQG